ncbi:hypothetical protein Tco_1401315 [Tanacetum coccineum]
MDSSPIQPSASTPVVVELHKEDQQATGGPTSLGVTSEDGAHPQLSSGMSAFIHIKPVYSTSTIIHSESASEHDVSASSKVEADFGLSTPKDSIPQTTGKDEGSNKLSLDNIFVGTNPHVLVEKMKYTSEGLETVLTPPTIGKGANNVAKEIEEEFNTSPDLSNSNDTLKGIKLEDLSKLVQDAGVEFMNLDSPNDNEPIIVQDDSDEEVHAKKVQTEEPKETADALAPHPASQNSIQIQELTNQVKFPLFRLRSRPWMLFQVFSLSPPNSSPQYEGELIKKDKGKKVMSSKDAEEEDPLDKLNDLAKKKRKNADDIYDYFRENKSLKSSVQYEDHRAGTMLNEPVLCMIIFNSYHRQDFVSIEDFGDFLNEMLEISQMKCCRLYKKFSSDFIKLMYSQEYYAGQGSGYGNQDNYQSQDYSMCHGLAHGSAHGSALVDDDSPVKEMSPVKSKKPSKHASMAKKNDTKEPPK